MFDYCNKKVSLIGNCNTCLNSYCNVHRLLEMHNCVKINERKKFELSLLSTRLPKVVSEKI